jgi:hypothetical protein
VNFLRTWRERLHRNIVPGIAVMTEQMTPIPIREKLWETEGATMVEMTVMQKMEVNQVEKILHGDHVIEEISEVEITVMGTRLGA